MIAEIYTKMSRDIKYPSMDEKRLAEIEDMAGKQNRIDAKEKYKQEIQEAKRKYMEEQCKIDREFKFALFKEYDIENHPKREKLFSMAWEIGHSSGYSEVECKFSELVDLIKD